MDLDIRYASHPDDVKHYTTEQLRRHFLIDSIFAPDRAKLTYSHLDRFISGGILPIDSEVSLDAGKEMGSDYFVERREGGVINIAGTGSYSFIWGMAGENQTFDDMDHIDPANLR